MAAVTSAGRSHNGICWLWLPTCRPGSSAQAVPLCLCHSAFFSHAALLKITFAFIVNAFLSRQGYKDICIVNVPLFIITIRKQLDIRLKKLFSFLYFWNCTPALPPCLSSVCQFQGCSQGGGGGGVSFSETKQPQLVTSSTLEYQVNTEGFLDLEGHSWYLKKHQHHSEKLIRASWILPLWGSQVHAQWSRSLIKCLFLLTSSGCDDWSVIQYICRNNPPLSNSNSQQKENNAKGKCVGQYLHCSLGNVETSGKREVKLSISSDTLCTAGCLLFRLIYISHAWFKKCII